MPNTINRRTISNRGGRTVSYALMHRAERPLIAVHEVTPRGQNVIMLSPEELTDLFQFSMFDLDCPGQESTGLRPHVKHLPVQPCPTCEEIKTKHGGFGPGRRAK